MKKRRGRRGESRKGVQSFDDGSYWVARDVDTNLGSLFNEKEDDVVRRLMDRVHKGYSLRAISRI